MNISDFQNIISNLAGDPRHDVRPRPLAPQIKELKDRRVTEDGRDLYPEEISALESIAREIDEEANLQIAWEVASDIRRLNALKMPADISEVQRGVAGSIHKSTVPYFNQKTGESASGVVVGIESRVFVATVAHALPARPQGKIAFVAFDSTAVAQTTPKIIYSGKVGEERPDIGFIEVAPDFVESLRRTPIALDRLSPCGPGRPNCLAYLFGFPASLSKRFRSGVREETISFRGQCFANLPLIPDDWQHIPEGRDPLHKPDPTLDVILPYPRDEEFVSLERDESVPDQLPLPQGMSGGGLWQGPEEQAVWTPENYKLIGIQSRWPAKGRYLQATQIIHWLRLVCDRLPELRAAIEDTFPDETFN